MTRLFSTLIIVFAVFAASRAMIRALPGDPLDTLVAETGTSIPRAELRHEMGLDRPFFSALLQDTERAVEHGDLGRSLFSKQPIAPLIRSRFENTAILVATSSVLAIAISLILGLLGAATPHSIADRICTIFGGVSAALPTPWIGPMLIICFAVWIPLFPLGHSVILPAITLALAVSGVWCRLVRARVRDVLAQGSAQAARARGIPEWRVLVKYGLAPASGMLIAYLGTQLGVLLAGAFVTEMIFDWRGMGTLWITAVLRRDYPVVEAATFVAASTTLVGVVIGDWIRDRIEKRGEKLL